MTSRLNLLSQTLYRVPKLQHNELEHIYMNDLVCEYAKHKSSKVRIYSDSGKDYEVFWLIG